MSTDNKQGGSYEDLLGRVQQLTERIDKIERYLTIAATVAVIFGIGGAWGLTIVSSVTNKVNTLNDHVSEATKKANGVDGTLRGIEVKISNLQFDIKTMDNNRELANARAREEIAKQEVLLQKEYRVEDNDRRHKQDDIKRTIDQDKFDALDVLAENKGNTEKQLLEYKNKALTEIDSRLGKRMAELLLSAQPVWTKCAWVTLDKELVNYPEKHPNENWCPEGEFLTQLDLGYFTIDKALCCLPSFELPRMSR